MRDSVQDKLIKYRRSRLRKKRWQRVVSVLASVTVFCTTYALILPAITMEQPTYCGMEEHTEHTAECYTEVRTLVCELPEWDGHVHGDPCFNEAGELVCGLSEGEGAHRHDDSCWQVTTELTCDKPIHQHSQECFIDPDAVVPAEPEETPANPEETPAAPEETPANPEETPAVPEETPEPEEDPEEEPFTLHALASDEAEFFISGAIPEGAELSVLPAELTEEELSGYLKDNAGVSVQQYAAYDVTVLADGAEWQPEGEVSVKISKPVVRIEQTDLFKIARIDEEGNAEKVEEPELTAEGDLLFDTDEFSVYLIYTYTEDSPEDAGETEDPETPEETPETPEEIPEPEENPEEEPLTLHATAEDGAEVLVSGEIPEGAEVTIVPVTLTEEELSGYLGNNAGISVQEYVVYDITILVDGAEWQPDETVSVTVRRPAIQIEENNNFALMHIDAEGNAEKVEAEVTPEGEVLFDAGGFSLYLFYTYTVDFHYQDFTFSINGEESILLSRLFEALGIDADIADVLSVEFTDETLLRVEKLDMEDGPADWRLTSLLPFETEEELTVTLAGGDILRIYVTDAPGGGGGGGGGGGYTDPIDPVPAPDYIGKYPTGNGSTEWQITKEEYAGRAHSDKIGVDADNDGQPDVWLQKNVVPTSVENEFLVYLSLDKKMTFEEFLDHNGVAITTSDKYGKDPVGSVYERIVGNATAELLASGEQGSYTNRYYMKIVVYQTHSSPTPIYSYYDWRYGQTSNCSNGSLFMTVPGLGFVLCGREVNLHGDEGTGTGNPLVLTLYLDDLSTDFSYFDMNFNLVTDVLGPEVEVIDFPNNHTCDGTAEYDDATRTILWHPAENQSLIPAPINPPLSAWQENICQLVYRVRLNVMDGDFVPCADTIGTNKDSAGSKQASINAGESFNVNNSAVLDFDKVALPNTSGVGPSQYGLQATFPVPKVRGLRYDITFIKINEQGRQLANAKFALYQADGTTPVLDENGDPMTLTTDASAVSRFPNLPWGTYVLKETEAPSHYLTPQTNTWSVRLCETDSWTLLEPDASPFEHNMRYKGNDTNGQWRITNPRNPFQYKVQVLKLDENNDPLTGAGFSIGDPAHAGQTLTGTTGTDGKYLFNAPFKPNTVYILSEISPPGGYFSLPANIQFKITEDTTNDTYTAEFINSADFGGTVSLELKESGTGQNTTYTLEVTVLNQVMYTLPETGGTGTLIYSLSGITLLGAALMAGLRSRRERERRAKE